MTDQPNQADLLDCQHQNTQFVRSGRYVGTEVGAGRHEVRVCRDCGLILLFAEKQGVAFRLNFHIAEPETVALIAKWPAFVHRDQKPGFPTNDEFIALAKAFYQETGYNLFDWIDIKMRQGGWENGAIHRQLLKMEFNLSDLMHKEDWQFGTEETGSK